MKTAPDNVSEAARQTWRAASCILALAVLVAVIALVAPERGYGLQGFDVALGVAGFVTTRLLMAEPPGWRGGAKALARAALWASPALCLVCAAVLGTGLLLLPPGDLRHQAWTALWTAFGGSGWELAKQGAWAPATSNELLMPGWIVGVAAQLVVGWTLVVAAFRRLNGDRWIAWIAVLGVLTATTVQIVLLVRGASAQAFYLAPPRAGTFLIGALLALRRWPFAGGVLERPLALAAPLGAVALPFWLWVWPLLALPRMILARPLQPAEVVVALAGAGLLAIGTARWVDRPLRRRFSERPVAALSVSGAMLAAVAAAAAILLATDGLPGRASAAVRAEEASARVRPPLQTACEVEDPVLPPASACTVPAGRPADVILWGNSHGSHLSPALLAWAGSGGHAVRQATMSGCLPLVSRESGLVSADCARFNQLALAEWTRLRPDLIVIGAGWTVVLEHTPGNDRAELDILDRDLRLMLDLLRAGVGPETRIVLLGNTPDYGFAPGACHARRAFLGLDTGRCDRAVPTNVALAARVDARLERIAAGTPGLFVFRPSTVLCDGSLCRTRGPDGAWYSDRSHMTEAGGRAQTSALSAVLDRAMAGR